MLALFWYRDQTLRLWVLVCPGGEQPLVSWEAIISISRVVSSLPSWECLFSSFTHSIIHINNHRRHWLSFYATRLPISTVQCDARLGFTRKIFHRWPMTSRDKDNDSELQSSIDNGTA
jgi:hypothetical protein